ncbi:hypothetical protein [Pseudomonas leptonychotis]|uniref:hypothetical protein n=1 Tax=Pseudomonas leptonychotis TaxID=2448482 RepID=UPI003866826C
MKEHPQQENRRLILTVCSGLNKTDLHYRWRSKVAGSKKRRQFFLTQRSVGLEGVVVRESRPQKIAGSDF